MDYNGKLLARARERLARLRVVFQLTDSRHFFTALLNNMQRQRMKRACGNVFGM